MIEFNKYHFRSRIRVCTLFCMALFSVVITDIAYSATYYSRLTGNFSSSATWSSNPTGTPINRAALTNEDIFIIQFSHMVTLDANRTVVQFTVNRGGTLNLTSFNLLISTNWQNEGTISGTSGSLCGGSGIFINNGNIRLTTGRIIQTTGTLNNSASGSILFTGAGTINFGTGNFINSNTSESVNFGSSAITFTGTAVAQNIDGFVTSGRVYYTKSAGRLTFTGDVSMNGLTVNSTGSAILHLGNGLNHTSSGAVIITAGTLDGGSSNLKISATGTIHNYGEVSLFTPFTGSVNLNTTAIKLFTE